MPTDHDILMALVKDVRALKGGGGTGQTIIVGGTTVTPTPVGVLVDGQLIAAERNLNFVGGFTVTDDPGNQRANIQAPVTAGTAGPGSLDLGAGAATGVGYTSLSATTFTALDLNQDLPIRAAAGDAVRISLQAYGTVAAGGALFLDVLSVNSGLFASGSSSPSGPGWMRWPASYTGPIIPTFWLFLTAQDIVNNTAILRLMYRVGGGTSTILANDPDGHLKALAWNEGTAVAVPGQNTGAPPVTPPVSGTFTDGGMARSVNVTTATATLSSATITPVAGEVVALLALVHLTSINAAAQNLNATPPSDTWGDSGGTAWTLQHHDTQAAPNAANSNGYWFWTRTIGTGPSAGHAVVTRNAGNIQQDFYVWVGRFNGYLPTPSQPVKATGNNVASLTTTMSPVGSTSAILSWAINATQSATAPAPTVPTQGGTWTTITSEQGDGAGWGIAIIPTAPPASETWGILSDAAISLAGSVVMDPSGSPTAAPGTETFTHADKSGATADQTWVDMTL